MGYISPLGLLLCNTLVLGIPKKNSKKLHDVEKCATRIPMKVYWREWTVHTAPFLVSGLQNALHYLQSFINFNTDGGYPQLPCDRLTIVRLAYTETTLWSPLVHNEVALSCPRTQWLGRMELELHTTNPPTPPLFPLTSTIHEKLTSISIAIVRNL